MQKTLALLLATVVLAAASTVPTLASDALCGPNGPEAYKRPGGYCEQLKNNGSAASETGEVETHDYAEPEYAQP